MPSGCSSFEVACGDLLSAVDVVEAGFVVSLAAGKLYPYDGIISVVVLEEKAESDVGVEALDVKDALDCELDRDTADLPCADALAPYSGGAASV